MSRSSFRIALLAGFLAAPSISPVMAEPLRVGELMERVVKNQPQLAEDSLQVIMARDQVKRVKTDVILPRFNVSVAFGPAPGFRYDTTMSASGQVDSTRRYSWWPLGPYFGTEMEMAQPLNVQRLRAGLVAARSNVAVQEARLDARLQDYLKDAAGYAYGYLYARTMRDLVEKASRELDRADSTLRQKVDAEDEDVSQADLLQLRAGRFEVDKGIEDARLNLLRAAAALRFSAGLRLQDSLELADSVLAPLPDLPSLESLRASSNNPTLRELKAGLQARKALVEVARGELGPDIFLFGSFKYTKAWVANRNRQNQDVLVTDPINDISGAIGLGFRWHLNVWARYAGFRKAKMELGELERKDAYARGGLDVYLTDAWLRYRSWKAKEAAASRSLEAANSWLTSVALQVDVDPSAMKDLVGPYKAVLGLKKDYYECIYQGNLAAIEVLRQAGLLTPTVVRSW